MKYGKEGYSKMVNKQIKEPDTNVTYFRKWRTWTKDNPRAARHTSGCANSARKGQNPLHTAVLFFYPHLENFLPILHLWTGFRKNHTWTYAAQFYCWILRKEGLWKPYHCVPIFKGWLQRRQRIPFYKESVGKMSSNGYNLLLGRFWFFFCSISNVQVAPHNPLLKQCVREEMNLQESSETCRRCQYIWMLNEVMRCHWNWFLCVVAKN